jgi:3-oxoacyl-[acyl-carrier-protein] synthase-3
MHGHVADDVRHNGNTSAAPIPLALTALAEQNDISGKVALFAGFGADLIAAAVLVRLPDLRSVAVPVG